MLGGDVTHADGLLPKPPTKTSREQNLPIPGTSRVPLFFAPLCKRSNLCRQWAIQWLRQDNLVINNEPHD
jgi:hypothetical protein